ncbi:hypothetical protein HDK64DRAFT_1197 [Phyllosticta capitalensis]
MHKNIYTLLCSLLSLPLSLSSPSLPPTHQSTTKTPAQSTSAGAPTAPTLRQNHHPHHRPQHASEEKMCVLHGNDKVRQVRRLATYQAT